MKMDDAQRIENTSAINGQKSSWIKYFNGKQLENAKNVKTINRKQEKAFKIVLQRARDQTIIEIIILRQLFGK